MIEEMTDDEELTTPPYAGHYRSAWRHHQIDTGHSVCSPSFCWVDIEHRVAEILTRSLDNLRDDAIDSD
jgi:hypothetical protein